MPSGYEQNDGRRLPPIGLGTLAIKEPGVIAHAIDLGYRLLDTAASYGNESVVGRAIEMSSISRDEIVVTTKVRGRDQGYEEALAAARTSLRCLGLDYVDLLLIHWPLPRLNKYVDTWRALVQLRNDGLARSIGVSNFNEAHLERIVADTGVVPAVNQIELHPYFPQPAMRAVNRRFGVVTEAWTPLGKAWELLGESVVTKVATSHEITSAQAVLAWHHGLGVVPIPKAGSGQHQSANLAALDIELDPAEIERISGLERGRLRGDRGDPELNEDL